MLDDGYSFKVKAIFRQNLISVGTILTSWSISYLAETFMQLSYFSGFELKKGSKVQILSGDIKFDLETLDGQMAWTKNSREDGYLFGSIIENRHIVIGAHSASGAVTVDTFDMNGVLGAFEKVISLCDSDQRIFESKW